MQYCLKHSVQTPDGTILECKHRRDFQIHTDKNGKTYYIDGLGYYTRSGGDIQDCKDLSIWFDTENIELTDEIRLHKFWRSFGKDGEFYPEGKMMCLSEMEDEHVQACHLTNTILCVSGTEHGPIARLFEAELKFRALL